MNGRLQPPVWDNQPIPAKEVPDAAPKNRAPNVPVRPPRPDTGFADPTGGVPDPNGGLNGRSNTPQPEQLVAPRGYGY
jgi:hypothetical protein